MSGRYVGLEVNVGGDVSLSGGVEVIDASVEDVVGTVDRVVDLGGADVAYVLGYVVGTVGDRVRR